MKLRFKTSITPKGVEIAGLRKSVLSWRPAPIEEWAKSEGRERVAAIHLQDLLDRDEAMALDCALLLPHSVAARLTSMMADAIGLPPVASLSANLAFEGRVEQRESLIRVRWFDRNLRVIIPQRIGAFLKWGSDEGRLSRQLFALMEAVDGFNASQGTERDERIKAWSLVQDALRQTTGAEVRSDDYLAGLTIFQAGAFALECRKTGGGPSFRPILMSRSKASSLEDDAPVTETQGESPASEALRDERADALLTPEFDAKFIEQSAGPTRNAYVLGRNTYLVIDPDLKIALDVVRQKQAASKDERQEFMKNPRAAIAEALGTAQEEAATSLFVETAQYSDRVLELGLWEPPVLAWIKRKSGQWLPESFPISVGSRQITMTPDSATTLKQNCAAARQAGEADIEVQGERHSIDIVEQGVQEAEALYGTFNPDRAQPPADAADDAIQAGDPSAPPEDPVSGDDLVLLIKTNIDGLDYELVHPRREARIARDLPHQALGRTTPQPHQLEGFDWLVKTWSAGWPGVLLADDMGLGKTFQALLFLAWIRRNELASGRAEPPTKRPILIVAPTALLTNWIAESVRHLAQHALGTCVEAFGSSLGHRLIMAQPDAY